MASCQPTSLLPGQGVRISVKCNMTREMSREMFFTFREMYPTFISRNVKNISRLKKYCLPFILNNLRFKCQREAVIWRMSFLAKFRKKRFLKGKKNLISTANLNSFGHICLPKRICPFWKNDLEVQKQLSGQIKISWKIIYPCKWPVPATLMWYLMTVSTHWSSGAKLTPL